MFTDPGGLSATAKTNFYFTDDYSDIGDKQIDFQNAKPSLINLWSRAMPTYTTASSNYLFQYESWLGLSPMTLNDMNQAVWKAAAGNSITVHMASLVEMRAMSKEPYPLSYRNLSFWTSTPGTAGQYWIFDMVGPAEFQDPVNAFQMQAVFTVK